MIPIGIMFFSFLSGRTDFHINRNSILFSKYSQQKNIPPCFQSTYSFKNQVRIKKIISMTLAQNLRLQKLEFLNKVFVSF